MDGAIGMPTRTLLSMLLMLLATGCTTIVHSDLVGECKVLAFDQKLWVGREEGSVGQNLMTSLQQEEIMWSRKSVAGIVEKGTKIRVENVISGWNGSSGRYLRVQVKILDGPFSGVVTDIPAKAPYHPGPSWVNFTLDPNELRLDPYLLKDC